MKVLFGGIIAPVTEVPFPGICDVGTADSDAMSVDLGTPPVGGRSRLEAAADDMSGVVDRRGPVTNGHDPDAERFKTPMPYFAGDPNGRPKVRPAGTSENTEDRKRRVRSKSAQP